MIAVLSGAYPNFIPCIVEVLTIVLMVYEGLLFGIGKAMSSTYLSIDLSMPG